MQCSEIQDMLSAFIDEALNDQEKIQMEKHLQNCEDCSKELAELQDTVKLLRSLGEVMPPEGFVKQVKERLENKMAGVGQGRWVGWKKGFGGLVSGSRKYVAAAAVILGLGLSIGLYNLTQGEMFLSLSPMYDVKSSENIAPQEYKYGAAGSGEVQDTGMLKSAKAPQIAQEDSYKYGISATMEDRDERAESTAENADSLSSKQKMMPPAGNVKIEASGQKIIKNGYLSLEVENYKQFSPKLANLVEQYGGYVENSSESSDRTVVSNFVIRVPARSFAEMVSRIEAMGKITGKQISGNDVTAEYTDTESRLRNLQRQEQRLLELVDKAKSLSDVLTLENELGRIRGEIEALQGRLRYLDDTVTYSTIRLDVKEIIKPTVDPAKGTFGKAWEKFKESLVGVANFAGDLIVFAGWLLPWAAMVIMIGGGMYFLIKKRKNKSSPE